MEISFDCNGTPAQQWQLNLGATAVQLANTNFCLDAGDGASLLSGNDNLVIDMSLAPTNGTLMKIWECFPGIPAQSWFLTTDARIALINQGTS